MSKYRVTTFRWYGGEIREHVDVEADTFSVDRYADGPVLVFFDEDEVSPSPLSSTSTRSSR
jgi:hypothetical protein